VILQNVIFPKKIVITATKKKQTNIYLKKFKQK